MHLAPQQIIQAPRMRPNGLFACIAALLGCCCLAGCGTAALTTGKVAELALNAVGIKVPRDGAQGAPLKRVEMRIRGAADLNAGVDGIGLSTVVRLYKLRDQTGFLSLPYAAFGDSGVEKAALGTDLIDVKEVVLQPAQTLDFQEKAGADVHFLGIVALFRSPDPLRWRVAFPVAEADRSTIAIDLHACAMTSDIRLPVGTGPKINASLPQSNCK